MTIRYHTRVYGSQRPSASGPVTIEPNFAGQGGDNTLTFFDGRRYHTLTFETMADWKAIASIIGRIRHNIKE